MTPTVELTILLISLLLALAEVYTCLHSTSLTGVSTFTSWVSSSRFLLTSSAYFSCSRMKREP